MLSFEKFKKTHHKLYNYTIPLFQRAGIEKEAEKMSSCGGVVYTQKCAGCGTNYFKGYNRCKSKYCPTCSRLKSYIWCAKLYPTMEEWIAKGKSIHFATFTLKNMESLKSAVEIVNEAWRFMTNKAEKEEFGARFAGGVRSLEVKIGKNSGLWHAHIHALILKIGTSRDFKFLRRSWNSSCLHVVQRKMLTVGDMKKIGSVDIRAITPSANGKNPLLAAIMECTKYITKLRLDIPADKLTELYTVMKGRRQTSCWGILYGTTSRVDEEMNECGENEITDFLCTRCGCKKSELEMLYEDATHWQNEEMEDLKSACTFAEGEATKGTEDDYDL